MEYTDRWYIDTGSYVFFEGKWTDFVSNKLFKVGFSQRFPVRYSMIIEKGRFYDFDLSDNGLYPENPRTLYEIGFGMSGSAVVHVRIPSNRYYNVLEDSDFIPSEDLTRNEYVGGFTETEIPAEEPRRLRVYTLKDMTKVVLRVFNDGHEDEKVVLHVTVNRMRLDSVSSEEERKIREKLDELIGRKLYVLKGYELAGW